jgi:protein TonB
MFTTLVESRAPKARRMGGTVVSAVVHGALIAGAVLVTLPGAVEANPKPVEPDIIWIPIDRIPEPTHGLATGGTTTKPIPQPPTVPINIIFPDHGQTNVSIDPGPVVSDPDFTIGRGRVGAGTPIGGGVPGGLEGGGGIWSVNEVDRSPSIAGRPVEPRYPTQLRAAGIEGRVVLQFVVDTLGRAEPGDVTVLETSHPQFAEAVREVLPRFRFIPGEASGHKVRTRVQIPFDFKLAR